MRGSREKREALCGGRSFANLARIRHRQRRDRFRQGRGRRERGRVHSRMNGAACKGRKTGGRARPIEVLLLSNKPKGSRVTLRVRQVIGLQRRTVSVRQGHCGLSVSL